MKSEYIKSQLDKWHKENEGEPVGLQITGIDKPIDCKEILWSSTADAMNTGGVVGGLHLCYKTLEKEVNTADWMADIVTLGRTIRHMLISTPLPSYDFIRKMKRLYNLEIYNATNLTSIDFISGLLDLNYLSIVSSKRLEDIEPIIRLQNRQFARKESSNIIFDVILVDCNISSLEAFRKSKLKAFGELILRYNSIESIEPLKEIKCSALNLSHNRISSINSLIENDCIENSLNVRWNNISDISTVIAQKKARIRKLFIGHNPIDEEQLIKVETLMFETDARRNKRAD